MTYALTLVTRSKNLARNPLPAAELAGAMQRAFRDSGLSTRSLHSGSSSVSVPTWYPPHAISVLEGSFALHPGSVEILNRYLLVGIPADSDRLLDRSWGPDAGGLTYVRRFVDVVGKWDAYAHVGFLVHLLGGSAGPIPSVTLREAADVDELLKMDARPYDLCVCRLSGRYGRITSG